MEEVSRQSTPGPLATSSQREETDAPAGDIEARGDRDAQDRARLEGCNDARTGMPPGIPGGAMCVQRFDDSRNSAIHITFRISLRSSSMPEPRDPLLKVLFHSQKDSDDVECG